MRCTIEVTRDDAYAVAVFRPLSQLAALVNGVRPVPSFKSPEPDLPAGLCDFTTEGFARGPRAVGLKLDKDAAGRIDPTPALVAADWLRDRGWEVFPLGVLSDLFARAEGTRPWDEVPT